MSNTANAVFTEGSIYRMNVSGFRYVKDYAIICGTVNDTKISAIIGAKLMFPMSEMFQLKQASFVEVLYKGIKEINGVEYQQFSAGEIGI